MHLPAYSKSTELNYVTVKRYIIFDKKLYFWQLGDQKKNVLWARPTLNLSILTFFLKGGKKEEKRKKTNKMEKNGVLLLKWEKQLDLQANFGACVGSFV